MTIPSKENIQFASAHLIDDTAMNDGTGQNNSVPVVKVPSTNLLVANGQTPSFYGTAIQVPATAVTTTNDPIFPQTSETNQQPGYQDSPSQPIILTAHATPIYPVVHPRIQEFKERRKRRQAVALVTGGVVGGILLGPLGGVLVAFISHGITKSAGRARQAALTNRILAEENAARL